MMRRRFGRPMRRMLRRDIPALLIRANQSLVSGSFEAAAMDLEQLARAADARGGRRAPLLYLQAGRARLMAGQPAPAMEALERGFGLLAGRGQSRRLASLGSRAVGELRQRGFRAEADRLAAYIESLGPGSSRLDALEPQVKRPLLPTHCPSCGAPLRPEEVEWLDERTAECAFCGSPVRED